MSALADRLRRLPVLGTALAVQDRYRADAADLLAASIGFFGFLSLFPLIVLALAVAGYVLAGRPEADVLRVAEAIQEAIPGLSSALGSGCPAGVTGCASDLHSALTAIVDNRGSIGAVGLVSLLLTGLKVTSSTQRATMKILRVDLLAQKGWRLRLGQLRALVVLGVVALLGVGAPSLVAVVSAQDPTGAAGVLAPVAAVALTFVADVVLFLAAYRIFATAQGPGLRALVPGALLAATGWTLLKVLGATLVARQLAAASELYGALAGVVTLLLLLYLAARLYVYGAELSAVRLEAAGPGGPLGVGSATAVAGAFEPPVAEGTDADEPSAVDGSAPVTSEASTAAASRELAAPRLAADEPTPTVSATTRRRLEAAVAPPVPSPRHGAAVAIAVSAVAGLVAAMRPWDRDD